MTQKLILSIVLQDIIRNREGMPAAGYWMYFYDTNSPTTLRNAYYKNQEGNQEYNEEIHTSETVFKLIDFVVGPERKDMLDILEIIQESCSLEAFLFVIGRDNCMKIKEKLEHIKGEHPIYDNALRCISDIYRSRANILYMGNGSESRKNAAKKGMKFGAIGGVITALAVGLGLYFGTGAALTVLPSIIGIALVAALAVGAVIDSITYDVLKPDSCIDTVYTIKGLDTLQTKA